MKITQKELVGILDYNPDSGVFIWKQNRGNAGAKKGDIAGSINNEGYLHIRVGKGRRYKAHRLAWLYIYGEYPNGDIDHINHIRTDNRISNLRVVSNRENSINRSITRKNKSCVVGVHWCKDRNKWHSDIRDGGKRINLGYFTEFHEAVNARKNAEVLYGYHRNHGLK